MSVVNPEKIASYIREVANDKIVPRFRQLQDHEIATKSGPTDLVTIADIEAEEDLTHIFKDLIPSSIVIGEEAVSKGEIDMSLLRSEEGFIWVIDPVDGTNNFASGNERFGTIVTLVKGGQSIQGWILDIPNDRLAISEQGSGVEVNGTKVSFPKMTEALNDTRGFISRKFLPKKLRDDLKETLDTEFGNIETYLCCAHEYLDILAGESYFSLYSRIRPWDHLTGAMMMSEAGGYARKWDKSLYGPGDEVGGLICTDTEESWDQIYNLLLKQYLETKAA